jgi:hypothetical protein
LKTSAGSSAGGGDRPQAPSPLAYRPDFADLLALLAKHRARYLIVGGMAFIYHAKPRYTKDMDLWVDPAPRNVERANRALAEFGSPYLLDADAPGQVVQIGVAPSRVDILLEVQRVRFETAWRRRARGRYGQVRANWIALDGLIRSKQDLDHPRHREDVRILRQIRRGRKQRRCP